MAEEEGATVVVMEDMVEAEEDMVADMVDTVDMVVTDMAKRRETPMLSQRQMQLQKPMPIMVMEAMEADMVMVDTEDTAMGANGDQQNPATDMVVTEEAMEAMVDMEVMAATDMDIMVEIG